MSSMRTPKSVEVEEGLTSGQEPQSKIKNKKASAVATIAGSATAVPPNVLSREVVKNRIGEVFSLDGPRLDAIRDVIDNSAIDQRYSVFPPDYTIEPRPLSKINQEYQEKSVELGLQVAEHALAQAGMTPTDVDLLVTVSCTGVMIPSLDALSRHDHGIPSRCSPASNHRTRLRGGRRGPGTAWEYLNAFPDRTALLISVETPHAYVSAQGFLAGQSDFGGAVWRWRGGRGGHRPRGSGAAHSGVGMFPVSEFAGRDGF